MNTPIRLMDNPRELAEFALKTLGRITLPFGLLLVLWLAGAVFKADWKDLALPGPDGPGTRQAYEQRFKETPPDQNAYTLLDEARKIGDKNQYPNMAFDDIDNWITRGDKPFPGSWKAVEDWFAPRQRALELVRAAAQRPAFAPGFKKARGGVHEISYPDMHVARYGDDLLYTQMLLAARDNNPDLMAGAAADWLRLVRLAQNLPDAPMRIWLTGGRLRKAIQLLTLQPGVPMAALDDAEATMKQCFEQVDLRRAMALDWNLAMQEAWDSYIQNNRPSDWPSYNNGYNHKVKAGLTFWFSQITGLQAAAAMNESRIARWDYENLPATVDCYNIASIYPARRTFALRDINEVLRPTRARMAAKSYSFSLPDINDLLQPAWNSTFNRYGYADSYYQLRDRGRLVIGTALQMRLALYARTHHKLPTSLAELGAADPEAKKIIAPYAGHLYYRPDPAGDRYYLIWDWFKTDRLPTGAYPIRVWVPAAA